MPSQEFLRLKHYGINMHYGENSEITLDSDEMTEWLKSIKKRYFGFFLDIKVY